MPDGAEGPVEATYSVTATYSAEVTYSRLQPRRAPARTLRRDDDAPATAATFRVTATCPTATRLTRWPQPAVNRRAPGAGPSPHVVQARRRTLTMVLLITVAVMGSAFIGLTPWWTVVPPFVMLGAYLLLLREAARADAEHAHSWAEAQALAAQAARAAELARERARQAHAVSPPQPTAEIITSPRWPAGPKTSSTTSTPTPKSAPSATDQAPGVRSGAPVPFRPGRTRSAAAVERTGPRVCYADWRSWGCSAVR